MSPVPFLVPRLDRRSEVAPWDRLHHEASAGGDADRLAKRLQVNRFTVGRERHHLVLVRRALEAEVHGQLLVHQSQRMRQLLRGQQLEAFAGPPPGQVRGVLTAAVEDEHGRGGEGRGQAGRGGVGAVMGDEPDTIGLDPGQGAFQEGGRLAGVERAQPLPVVSRHVTPVGPDQARIVGVSDRIEILGRTAGEGQTPRGGLLGQLPGAEWNRELAVLASREAFLFSCGDNLPIDDERRRGVVEDRIDPQDPRHCFPS